MKAFIGLGLLLAPGCLWAQYMISTFAGGAPPPGPVSATSASIGEAYGVATDASGNVYFASDNCVFKLDQTGVLTRVAGNSRTGHSGDGGLATNAQLQIQNVPQGIALDGAGNLYISDSDRIRKVSTGGIITTVTGIVGIPMGIAVDGGGNIYFAEWSSESILKLAPSGIITTVAGSGSPGYSGDGGPANKASLFEPAGVAVDNAANLYIADLGNNRVRKVSSAGIISTVAGSGATGLGNGGCSGDGVPATSAQLDDVQGVTVDNKGNLFIADCGGIREISPGGIITTVPSAGVSTPTSVATDATGNLYVGGGNSFRIWKISSTGTITNIAGNGTPGYSGDAGPATSAQLAFPAGVAADGVGNLYIADLSNSRIRKVSSSGIITTVAGNGTAGYSGDGGPAIEAGLAYPYGVAGDGAGDIYIADTFNHRIRKISPSGIIATVAGNGSPGSAGDGGPAINAQLTDPAGIAADSGGNLYIVDSLHQRIRKVSTGGVITTVVGNGTAGYSGDGGPATSAQLNLLTEVPLGIAVDGVGNLYIADGNNQRVRKVTTGGIITTVVGNGTAGYSGDGGPAASAQLYGPEAVALDSTGTLYIADRGNARVRKVTTGGIITTVAGTGGYGYFGDGGPATNASFGGLPVNLTVDGAGNIYVPDGSGAVRLLKPTSQPVLIGAVLDAASESATQISPGKIVVVYGGGLGPASLVGNRAANGAFGTQVGGTSVSFNGIAAPMIYASATQLAAIAPYEIAGSPTAQVTVTSQSGVSAAFTVPVAASAPSFFSSNGTGAGQIAAVNADGSLNNAANPVKIGGYISLYATGEGQTSPAGVDGKLASTQPYPAPVLPVAVTVGGITVTNITYAGAAPTEVAGLMQVVLQIPQGVAPGGYVPVVLQVGNSSTVNGAAWIAVSGN